MNVTLYSSCTLSQKELGADPIHTNAGYESTASLCSNRSSWAGLIGAIDNSGSGGGGSNSGSCSTLAPRDDAATPVVVEGRIKNTLLLSPQSESAGSLGSTGSLEDFDAENTGTPSPSDSGVAELEALLKEKDSEIALLRETLEHNEAVIFQARVLPK